MRFLILFIFLITNALASDLPEIKNIVIHKELKTYDNVIFLNKKSEKINIKNFKGNLILLNFWATWCEPCKEEMPSLDLLHQNKDLDNLKIFPINVGQENLEKTSIFFKDLKIENLKIYYDSSITLAKKLGLRGIPTTVLFNENGFEFARIVGSIDFNNREFIEWLKKYN